MANLRRMTFDNEKLNLVLLLYFRHVKRLSFTWHVLTIAYIFIRRSHGCWCVGFTTLNLSLVFLSTQESKSRKLVLHCCFLSFIQSLDILTIPLVKSYICWTTEMYFSQLKWHGLKVKKTMLSIPVEFWNPIILKVAIHQFQAMTVPLKSVRLPLNQVSLWLWWVSSGKSSTARVS